MLAGQNVLQSGQLQYRSEYSTPATEIEPGVYDMVNLAGDVDFSETMANTILKDIFSS